MPSRPWYKWYPGDWKADTQLLTLEEKGAYRELLDALWLIGPMEDSHRLRAQLWGVHGHTAKRLWNTLRPFCDVFDPPKTAAKNAQMKMFDHRKIAEQRAKSIDISEKRRTAAESRWNANASNARAYHMPEEDLRTSDLLCDPDGSLVKNASNGVDGGNGHDPSFSTSPAEPASKKMSPCPYDWIIDTYHERCPELPQFRKRTAARDKAMAARWREYPERDDWVEFFERVSVQPFLAGNNDRGWRANLAWLMKPENFAKVLEFSYERSTR